MLIRRELPRPIDKPYKVIKLGSQKKFKSKKNKLIQIKINIKPNILENKNCDSIYKVGLEYRFKTNRKAVTNSTIG